MLISFLIFPRVTQLDVMGPAQFLSRMPGARIELVAKAPGPVPTDAGFPILPTHDFASAGRPDILCVPGGFGITDVMEDPESLAWLRDRAETATWVTSVCTGSLVLGAAGLLKGYRATCHWASHEWLARFGAIPVKARVVFDRNRVSSGGVTGGIDFGLALAAAICGEETARLIQLSLEYDPAPPFDSGSPDKADAALLARYHAMVAQHAADRPARYEAAAARLRAERDEEQG